MTVQQPEFVIVGYDDERHMQVFGNKEGRPYKKRDGAETNRMKLKNTFKGLRFITMEISKLSPKQLNGGNNGQ